MYNKLTHDHVIRERESINDTCKTRFSQNRYLKESILLVTLIYLTNPTNHFFHCFEIVSNFPFHRYGYLIIKLNLILYDIVLKSCLKLNLKINFRKLKRSTFC